MFHDHVFPHGILGKGLTKRELFTLVALHGLLARDSLQHTDAGWGPHAVAIADATLAALNRQPVGAEPGSDFKPFVPHEADCPCGDCQKL